MLGIIIGNTTFLFLHEMVTFLKEIVSRDWSGLQIGSLDR
jgi:hypothetical protein